MCHRLPQTLKSRAGLIRAFNCTCLITNRLSYLFCVSIYHHLQMCWDRCPKYISFSQCCVFLRTIVCGLEKQHWLGWNRGRVLLLVVIINRMLYWCPKTIIGVPVTFEVIVPPKYTICTVINMSSTISNFIRQSESNLHVTTNYNEKKFQPFHLFTNFHLSSYFTIWNI
jgi:hypothetical protein